MYEIYFNSNNTALVVENQKTGEVSALKQMCFSWHSQCDGAIKLQYPSTYSVLCLKDGASCETAPVRVHTFCACNLSVKDGRIDIDDDWNFELERVPCPARITGICQGIICQPVITNKFTEREKEVLGFFVKGMRREKIAELLFISERTVGNHVNNMYKKIPIAEGTNPEIALVNFAHSKKIV